MFPRHGITYYISWKIICLYERSMSIFPPPFLSGDFLLLHSVNGQPLNFWRFHWSWVSVGWCRTNQPKAFECLTPGLFSTGSFNLGGGFKYPLFSLLFGEDFRFYKCFSEQLKPPTSLYNVDQILNPNRNEFFLLSFYPGNGDVVHIT